MSEITNEIAVIPSETLNGELANLSEGKSAGFYSSIKATDHASKLAVLDAMSNSVPLSDNLNKRIEVQNIIIQSAEMLDEKTGALVAQPRIIFISPDGTAYHAISNPLYRDVKNWFGILGEPAIWEAPIAVKITKQGTGTSQYFKASLTK